MVDIHKGDVMPPVHMRAEQGWTVGRFKEEIGKVNTTLHRLHLHLHSLSLSLSLSRLDMLHGSHYNGSCAGNVQ